MVANGRITFDGETLVDVKGDPNAKIRRVRVSKRKAKEEEAKMRMIRGARISMIFQDPMTSLNPVLTINEQHSPMIAQIAKSSTVELPPYLEKDANDKCKVTVAREPLTEEIRVDVSIIKVIEYFNLH